MGSVTNRNSFSVEPLEGREFLSASVSNIDKVWDDVPAATPAPAIARSMSPMATKVAASRYTNVIGTWKGTCKTAGTGTVTPISMKITVQSGAGARGTFSVGPISANQTVVSTAIVSSGSDRGFGVILQGKGFFGSITGAISKNGKEIVGRWACNGPGGWKTGSFVMDLK